MTGWRRPGISRWAGEGEFTVLNRGKTLGTYAKSEIKLDDLQTLMAGGKELQSLSAELGGTI